MVKLSTFILVIGTYLALMSYLLYYVPDYVPDYMTLLLAIFMTAAIFIFALVSYEITKK